MGDELGQTTAQDARFMAMALSLARRGLGRTAPNPTVGAVVVSADPVPVVLGRGWTCPGGRPHAETEALRQAGAAARGATLYVTLEPCAHHGKTPPCADAILAASIGRVVCALEDPDPRVAGKGLARLRAAGLAVTTGIGVEAARYLNLGHILRVTRGRPFVQLKMAVGADGRMARGTGRPVWVTGEVARARGHLMRAQSDAILVGRGTVVADDPSLDCRLPGMADRSPIRIVLDSHLGLSPQIRMLADKKGPPVWIAARPDAPQEAKDALSQAGAEILPVPATEAGVDLAALLAMLAERGITRLLVEGGPRVIRNFLAAGLADEVVVFQGRADGGAGGIQPLAGAPETVLPAHGFRLWETRPVGDDRMMVYRRAAKAPETAEKTV